MSFTEGLMLFPGIIVHPRATFQKLREADRGYWWLVLVVALVLAATYTLISTPYTMELSRQQVDAQFEEMYGDLDNLSDQEQQQYDRGMAMIESPVFTRVIPLASVLIVVPLGYVIMAGVLHLASAVLGGRAAFRQTFRMAVWTTVPTLIRSLLGIFVMLISGRLMAPGLTAGMGGPEAATTQPVLYAFLSMIDIFALWSLALIAIGVMQTAQVDTIKGIIVTAIWWVVSLVPVALAWVGQVINASLSGT
jgi:hypothetical protein